MIQLALCAFGPSCPLGQQNMGSWAISMLNLTLDRSLLEKADPPYVKFNPLNFVNVVESIAECVRDDPMSELTALTILRRLVSALCVLANRGIIHNDLSGR